MDKRLNLEGAIVMLSAAKHLYNKGIVRLFSVLFSKGVHEPFGGFHSVQNDNRTTLLSKQFPLSNVL
jgi:hypothetical protein